MFRCGNGGEVFILWNSLQSNNVFDGATRTVHGDCSGERECVVWDRAVAAFIGCIYRRFFSWSLPHHSYCYSYLHPGTSPSVSISLHFLFLFDDVTPFLTLFNNIWLQLFSARMRRARVDVFILSYLILVLHKFISYYSVTPYSTFITIFFLIYKICFININILKITLNLLHQIKLISSKD